MTVSPAFFRRVFCYAILFGCMVLYVTSSDADVDLLHGEELKLYCVAQYTFDDVTCVV